MNAPQRRFRPTGRVHVMSDESGRAAAMVLLTCESAFTARREEFRDYLHKLTHHVLVRRPRHLGELAGQDWVGGGPSVEEAQREFAEQVGESVGVARMSRLEVEDGFVWTHLAADGRAGVLLALRSRTPRDRARECLNHLCVQVLAERVSELVVGEDGPEELFDPRTLVDRPWRADPARSVQAALEESLGEGTEVVSFACFRV